MWLMTAGIPHMQERIAEGWAEPPKNLGEVIADELVRICNGREMVEPIVLDLDERNRMMQVVQAWGEAE